MKSGKVPFEGITGLAAVKTFLRIADDAQVTEGDIATIQNQAQSAYQTGMLALRRFVQVNDPAMFDSGILNSMEKSITSLQQASEAQASRVITNYYDGLSMQGLESIGQDTIDSSRASSFKMLGITPTEVPQDATPEITQSDADRASEAFALMSSGRENSGASGGREGGGEAAPDSEAGRRRSEMFQTLGRISQGMKFPPMGVGELPSVPLFSMDGAERQRTADKLRRYGVPEDQMKTLTLQEINRLLGR